MAIVTVGIDLAKSVFAIHGVDEAGKAVLVKPKVSRDQLVPLIAQLSPCLIGMEACSGAHYWARLFRQHRHTVKWMSPRLVAPYRMSGKRGKNDAADAAAICEAVTRPSMRFVLVKDEHQQATLSLHRTRQGFAEERTATYNRLRGLLAEFGVVLPQKPERLTCKTSRRPSSQVRSPDPATECTVEDSGWKCIDRLARFTSLVRYFVEQRQIRKAFAGHWLRLNWRGVVCRRRNIVRVRPRRVASLRQSAENCCYTRLILLRSSTASRKSQLAAARLTSLPDRFTNPLRPYLHHQRCASEQKSDGADARPLPYTPRPNAQR